MLVRVVKKILDKTEILRAWIKHSNRSYRIFSCNGVTVLGHFYGMFGGGEMARGLVRAMQVAHIDYSVLNYDAPEHAIDSTDFHNALPSDVHYTTKVVVSKASDTPIFFKKFGNHFFNNSYIIGRWAWELTKFPKDWMRYFSFYNEIWTISAYCAGILKNIAPIPIINIPLSVGLDFTPRESSRKRFNLSEDQYVFLFIFDMLSQIERKNPMGVIEAFKGAFGDSDKVALIIKSINGNHVPESKKILSRMVCSPNIHMIDSYMTKEETYQLIYDSDVYVSLHRAEGFGLTLAEAMLLKKPVIATAYSGNMEFMTIENSLPIKYKLTSLERDYGIYSKGNVWAEPDIDHAVDQMRYCFDHPEEAREIGMRGYECISTNFSHEVIGKKIRARMTEIMDLQKNR